jgi:hypothetical protein
MLGLALGEAAIISWRNGHEQGCVAAKMNERAFWRQRRLC